MGGWGKKKGLLALPSSLCLVKCPVALGWRHKSRQNRTHVNMRNLNKLPNCRRRSRFGYLLDRSRNWENWRSSSRGGLSERTEKGEGKRKDDVGQQSLVIEERTVMHCLTVTWTDCLLPAAHLQLIALSHHSSLLWKWELAWVSKFVWIGLSLWPVGKCSQPLCTSDYQLTKSVTTVVAVSVRAQRETLIFNTLQLICALFLSTCRQFFFYFFNSPNFDFFFVCFWRTAFSIFSITFSPASSSSPLSSADQ